MEKLYKILSDTQASLFVLFQKTWVYHWHITGPDFYQVHTLFGEQYTALFEEIDRISEHIRFLGAKPISSMTRVAEVSRVSEAKSGLSEMQMIQDLLDDHKKVVEMFSEAAEVAEELVARMKRLIDANGEINKFEKDLFKYAVEGKLSGSALDYRLVVAKALACCTEGPGFDPE